ncbi:HNH endonuclease signature motif containing protein [Oerskovia flava]|uniref:HNH endonuclease signature motif containing protein n=1 Tax=Oerskovia flava TaxID=2986422 RepID=UPI00223F0239|nr:HNH endonuclease signature motif containing protein [Oerskovia sp. JB1-3-2]
MHEPPGAPPRPSSTTIARVLARDRTCTFPGCTVAAFRCDVDHVVPPDPRAPGTDELVAAGNLIALCRHHHVVRARTGWRPALTAAGEVRWTAPSGHVYARARAQASGAPVSRSYASR